MRATELLKALSHKHDVEPFHYLKLNMNYEMFATHVYRFVR